MVGSQLDREETDPVWWNWTKDGLINKEEKNGHGINLGLLLEMVMNESSWGIWNLERDVVLVSQHHRYNVYWLD
jgi:hypothetical protein